MAAVDVRAFLDNARFSPYQIMLLFLCFLSVFFNGVDAQAVSVAAPAIRHDLGLNSAQFGAIFAASNVGGIVAGFAIAPFADHVGRRPLILATILASGIVTLSYTLAQGFIDLLLLRLAGGIVFGVAVTAVYTYSAEIVPKRLSATSVIISSSGFSLGVAVAGFLSGWLIPQFGWRLFFSFAGWATVAFGFALMWVLPESIRFLALRTKREPHILRFLLRVDRRATLDEASRYHLDEEKRPGLVMGNLLKEGRALVSFILWASFLGISVVAGVLVEWLPSLVTSAGGNAIQAGNGIGWFKVGGLLGSFVCAVYIDRYRNPYPILVSLLLLGCFSYGILGRIDSIGGVFMLDIFVCGVCIWGPMFAITGLAARLFPTYVRTAGVAITLGISRIGGATGLFFVGLLLQSGWSSQDVFKAAVVPVFLSAVLIVVLGVRDHRIHLRSA